MPDMRGIFHPWLRVVGTRRVLRIEKELPGPAMTVVAAKAIGADVVIS